MWERPPAATGSARAMNESTKAAKWFDSRRAGWREAERRLDAIEQRGALPPGVVFDAIRSYPEIARDLSVARKLAPNGSLTKRLERIYLNLHRTIFRPPARPGAQLRALFAHEAAAIVQSLRWHLLWVTVLFAASILTGYRLVAAYPELVGIFASEEMIDTVARGELWTDGLLNVFPSSLLAVRLFTNNIAVCLFALCLGAFYGLGTVYIIGINGLSIGAIFAFTAQHGLGGRLFEFVAAHGFVELSVICIAGAAGVSLGEALARPGHETRAAAFHAATMRCAKLALVCAAFLVGAGIIEGYVSPDPAYPLAARLAIGLAYFALLVLVLGGFFGRSGFSRDLIGNRG